MLLKIEHMKGIKKFCKNYEIRGRRPLFNNNLKELLHEKEIKRNLSQKLLVYLTFKLNFIFQKPYYREDLQS